MKSESETSRIDDISTMIISHEHPDYRFKWQYQGKDKWNGAYYYSKEIVRNIIPRVKTSRNWVTINVPDHGASNSVVFIHNNLHPEYYQWMARYTNMILVCGIPETVEKMEWLGRSICIPLSIDIEEVQTYKRKKDKDTAFVGRPVKRKDIILPDGIDYLEGLPRPMLLEELARYKRAYCVGRCALEALALGVEVLPYDPRFPDPKKWRLIDNSEAAELLQHELDIIDG